MPKTACAGQRMTARARPDPDSFGHTFPSDRRRCGRMRRQRTYYDTNYVTGAESSENKAVGRRLQTPDRKRLGDRTLSLPYRWTPPLLPLRRRATWPCRREGPMSWKSCRVKIGTVTREPWTALSVIVPASLADTLHGARPVCPRPGLLHQRSLSRT